MQDILQTFRDYYRTPAVRNRILEFLGGATPAEATCEFITADARRPPRAAAPCTLVFLDPPYGEGLAGPTLLALADAGWFGPGTIAVVETAHHDDVATPEGFAVVDERRYGKAKLTFLRRA